MMLYMSTSLSLAAPALFAVGSLENGDVLKAVPAPPAPQQLQAVAAATMLPSVSPQMAAQVQALDERGDGDLELLMRQVASGKPSGQVVSFCHYSVHCLDQFRANKAKAAAAASAAASATAVVATAATATAAAAAAANATSGSHSNGSAIRRSPAHVMR